jgi:hypothetical protein
MKTTAGPGSDIEEVRGIRGVRGVRGIYPIILPFEGRDLPLKVVILNAVKDPIFLLCSSAVARYTTSDSICGARLKGNENWKLPTQPAKPLNPLPLLLPQFFFYAFLPKNRMSSP